MDSTAPELAHCCHNEQRATIKLPESDLHFVTWLRAAIGAKNRDQTIHCVLVTLKKLLDADPDLEEKATQIMREIVKENE